MRKFSKLILVSALVAAFCLFPFVAQAQEDPASGERDDHTVLTIYERMLVGSEETIQKDIISFGGELVVDGTVEGNVVVFGNHVDISGTIDGDVVVVGGDLSIAESGIIGGGCSLISGTANLSGSLQNCDQPLTALLPASLTGVLALDPPLAGDQVVDDALDSPEERRRVGFFASSIGMIIFSLFAGFVAYMLASAFPSRLQQVKETIANKTIPSGSVGVLTAIASTSFLLLTSPIWIIVLILLSFVFGLGIIVGLGAILFMFGVVLLGWTAVGSLIGNRIAGRPLQHHHIDFNEPRIAALGTGIMTLVVLFLMTFFPIGGWLFGSALSVIGLGSVVLTRIGRQPYPLLNSDIVDIELVPEKVDSVLKTLPPE